MISYRRRILCLLAGVPLLGWGAYLLFFELIAGHAIKIVSASGGMLIFGGVALLWSGFTGR